MKIIGVGIDTALISRYKNKDTLAKRVLSENEYQQYLTTKDKAEFLASRFSIKESYVKASGDTSIDYRRIELRKENDVPKLYIDDKRTNSFVSLSHDLQVVSIVILYNE